MLGRLRGIFLSNLIYNISGLLILLLAAEVLSVSDYADFSMAVILSMVLVTAFDFGMNLTMVKKYKESNDDIYLRSTLIFKICLCVTVLVIAIVVSIVKGRDVDVVVAAVSYSIMLNIWQCIRFIDQARADFSRYTKNCYAFSFARLAFAVPALFFTENWLSAFAFSMLGPVMVFLIFDYVSRRESLQALDLSLSALTNVFSYSWWVYFGALAFTATLYSPQLIAKLKLEGDQVATLGLCLGLLSVVSLVFNSIRFVIFPDVVNGGEALSNMLRVLIKKFPIFLFSCVLVVGVLAACLNYVYQHKYPFVGLVFFYLASGLMVTSYVGLVNISVHALNIPWLEFAINTVRMITIVCVCFYGARDVLDIAVVYGFFLIIFEVVMAAVNIRMCRRKDEGCFGR